VDDLGAFEVPMSGKVVSDLIECVGLYGRIDEAGDLREVVVGCGDEESDLVLGGAGFGEDFAVDFDVAADHSGVTEESFEKGDAKTFIGGEVEDDFGVGLMVDLFLLGDGGFDGEGVGKIGFEFVEFAVSG
jgi:hypothetical protein